MHLNLSRAEEVPESLKLNMLWSKHFIIAVSYHATKCNKLGREMLRLIGGYFIETAL